MPNLELPTGNYLSVNMQLTATPGGLLRAMLLRNRLFVERAGITPTILLLRPDAHYAAHRDKLIEDGLLHPRLPVVSVYDHLRDAALDAPAPGAVGLPVLRRCTAVEETYADGSPYRTAYRDPGSEVDLGYDYRRRDGSVYLRIAFGPLEATTGGGPRARLVSPEGRVVSSFRSMRALYRHTIADLCPGPERVFLFTDSRTTVSRICPLPEGRIHVISVLHNQHTTGSRRWNSRMSPSYAAALSHLPSFDALVVLTERQRADIRLRFGEVSNVFVVPNPVTAPTPPQPLPARDARRLAVVSRLAPQKNLSDALLAFGKVLDVLPDARLDIYGEGPERQRLATLVTKLGLEGAVTLHGYHPQAKSSLWTASGFLMTSKFEGYPLATLEALAHGCPVIAYDIKYGPREQVTDGVDGYIVPPGDVAALAARAVTLLADPALRDRMSDAALLKAAAHGPDRFLAEWKHVLDAVVEMAPRRTRLESVRLDVQRLTRPGRAGRWLVAPPSRPFLFEGVLRVNGASAGADLGDATVVLTALGDVGGEHARLPLDVVRDGSEFRLRLATTTRGLFAGLSRSPSRVQLRLGLSWQNSSWQVLIGDGARWPRPLRPAVRGVRARKLQRRVRRLAAAARRRVRSRLRRGATPR